MEFRKGLGAPVHQGAPLFQCPPSQATPRTWDALGKPGVPSLLSCTGSIVVSLGSPIRVADMGVLDRAREQVGGSCPGLQPPWVGAAQAAKGGGAGYAPSGLSTRHRLPPKQLVGPAHEYGPGSDPSWIRDPASGFLSVEWVMVGPWGSPAFPVSSEKSMLASLAILAEQLTVQVAWVKRQPEQPQCWQPCEERGQVLALTEPSLARECRAQVSLEILAWPLGQSCAFQSFPAQPTTNLSVGIAQATGWLEFGIMECQTRAVSAWTLGGGQPALLWRELTWAGGDGRALSLSPFGIPHTSRVGDQ